MIKFDIKTKTQVHPMYLIFSTDTFHKWSRYKIWNICCPNTFTQLYFKINTFFNRYFATRFDDNEMNKSSFIIQTRLKRNRSEQTDLFSTDTNLDGEGKNVLELSLSKALGSKSSLHKQISRWRAWHNQKTAWRILSVKKVERFRTSFPNEKKSFDWVIDSWQYGNNNNMIILVKTLRSISIKHHHIQHKMSSDV